MVFKLKVKRGWDQACEKTEIALGAVGMLRGKPAMLVSVEMNTSHVLKLRFDSNNWGSSILPHSMKISHWLKAIIKAHR